MSKNFKIVLILFVIGILFVLGTWLYYKYYSTEAPTQANNSATVSYSSVSLDSTLIGNVALGTPSADSIKLNILAEKGMQVYVEYGLTQNTFTNKTDKQTSENGLPIVVQLMNLDKNTRYYYQIYQKQLSDGTFLKGKSGSFITDRNIGETFSFGVQGDSHPERANKMFNSDLYLLTMGNVQKVSPDIYFMLGDDFSIEGLIDSNRLSPQSVAQVYTNQRKYLGNISNNTSLFLVNGNHEQAGKYLLDGTITNPAVLAGSARTTYYTLPTPDSFYSANQEKVDGIGYLSDYYSFEWGNSLFIVIDPYWHSEVAVDNSVNGSKKDRDLWQITLGDTQYQWFKNTLANSNAKFKFVFTHHVLGTGRGGIEQANLYEWGGYSPNKNYDFTSQRPNWDLPIQQLMAKYDVTIFFQGHDHLFAKQELDGVIYQEVPNPADNTYTAFNKDAYKSGDIFPNSGFINVTVSANQVKVDYLSSVLPSDTAKQGNNNQIKFSYTITK